MKRIVDRILLLSVFLLALCAAVAPADVSAAPSGNVSIIVLPFQVRGDSADVGNLSTEIPKLFARSLSEQGFKVISPEQTMRLLRRQKVSDLNVAAVRNLANQSRVSYAVYGSCTLMPDHGFSIDARLVSAASGESASARPYFVQRGNLLELYPAVSELSASMAGDAVEKGALAGIQIRGLKILDPDAILMRLSISKGDTVDPVILNQELKRLWDTGYFSDASVSLENTGEGRMLVFTVVEKPRIEDVQVNGSDAVSKDDIIAAMSSKTGSVLNDKLIVQDLQKITDLYRQKGYYLAEVTYRVEERQGGASAMLVFDVKEGNKLYIKTVSVSGLETLSESDVKKELSLKERGLLSFITKTGVLREEYLERDSSAITAYGLNHGYVDIQVGAPAVTYEEDGIIIDFPVKEGTQYQIGEITFAGDLIDTPEKLNELIQLDDQKENEGYFALAVMQDDVKKLTDYYADYGYAFASVNPMTRRNGDNVIDIEYRIDKKQKVYIRRVTTEGNIRTRDNVILREMRLGDGDLFDGAKIRRSNERLNRLRYFSAVDTEVLPTDQPDEVDLNVKVKDDQTGMIMGGVGYSTYYQFGVTASVQERNLFGKGYLLGLQGFVSGRSTSVDMSFINPRLYDTDLGLTYNAYVVRDEWDDFRKRTIGNSVRLTYPLGEYTSVGVGYRLDRYTLYNIPESAPRSYKDYEGDNLSSVVSARIIYDSTDSRERPSKGYIFRAFAEYGGGGLGGNDNFFKPIGEAQGFHTLFGNKDHIFHWRGRIGAVYENSSKTVPVFDRFFIGGIDSIRGYDSDDISPRDPVYGDEIGGDRMGFLNLEYIWTVDPELGIALVPFFDIGFQNDSSQDSTFSNYKKSVGLELRWRSPMGDLRFAYGYPLDKSTTGEKLNGRFEFSMGQNF